MSLNVNLTMTVTETVCVNSTHDILMSVCIHREEGTFSQYREQNMIVGPPGKRGKEWRYKTSY